MAKKLALRYDKVGDILYVETCEPYAGQESDELGDEMVGRYNPKTEELESVMILFFTKRFPAGSLIALHCTYDPATRGGESPDGRRPKATLHWIAANHAVAAEVRLYNYLFCRPDPGGDGRDLFEDLNPASETVLTGCRVEPSLAAVPVGQTVQFERLGYFTPDPDSTPDHLVFNRTLTLKDTWAKVQARDR